MAKLSEQKKIELLENEVLTGTVENTAKIIAEYGPFEFTAALFLLMSLLRRS